MKFFPIIYLCLFFYLDISAQTLDYKIIDVASATNIAKSQSKNIFIQYEVEWCQDCTFLNDSVVANPYIISILKSDFVLIKAPLDHQNAEEWYKKYQVTCIPTVNILDPNGQVLFETDGMVSEEELYTALLDHAYIEQDNILAEAETEIAKTPAEILTNNSNNAQIEKSYSGATVRIEHESSQNNSIIDSNNKTPVSQKQIEKTIVDQISNDQYTVTVGAFSVFENAERQIHKLQDIHLVNEFFIEEDEAKNLYRVNVGRFEGRRACNKLVAQFQEEDVSCYIRKI